MKLPGDPSIPSGSVPLRLAARGRLLPLASVTDFDGKVWGGLALMVVGELATGGGIVLWALGGNKVRKYNNELNKRSGNLSLKTGKHGIGLIYRF